MIKLTINGREYIAVPVAEYERLQATGGSSDGRDGVDWAREEMGRTLRQAREAGGLSQGELAKKLGKSQTLVSRAESGDMSVSEKYVADVLAACGLPKDWPASAASTSTKKRATKKRKAA